MTLSRLLGALPFPCRPLDADLPIAAVTPDPDRCTPGSLFIAIEGFHRDGHAAIPLAIRNGASAVVIHESRGELFPYLEACHLPYVTVPDTRSAEAYLTARIYGDPQQILKMTAVTGTNGKTSITAMLAAIYRMAQIPCETVGTLSGKMTTPDPATLYPLLASFVERGITHVFLEASSHALALGKLAPIEFDGAIFTNLTPEHLDFHRDMDAYAAAKAKLFAQARRAIINLDDPYALPMCRAAHGTVYTVGTHGSADFRITNILRHGSYGITYDLHTTNAVFRIRSPIPGLFTAMNTSEAAVAAYTDGIPRDLIRCALAAFRGVKGRLERMELPTNEFSVYIDYAHTPDALENILRTVRGFLNSSQRLVLLFGCGGDRDRSKRAPMGRIASQLADYVILTADNSRSERTSDILSEIREGIEEPCSYTVIESRQEAIIYAIESARPGDVILLCGKGHEEYEIMPDGVHPFSERSIVQDAVVKRLKSKGSY